MGTARRMICVMGDVGETITLMPQARRTMEKVRANVTGEVELASAAAASEWFW